MLLNNAQDSAQNYLAPNVTRANTEKTWAKPSRLGLHCARGGLCGAVVGSSRGAPESSLVEAS